MKVTKKGWTLLELSVVLLVIGILFSLGYVAYQKTILAAEEASAIASLRAIHSAQAIFIALYGRAGTLKELRDAGLLQLEVLARRPSYWGMGYAFAEEKPRRKLKKIPSRTLWRILSHTFPWRGLLQWPELRKSWEKVEKERWGEKKYGKGKGRRKKGRKKPKREKRKSQKNKKGVSLEELKQLFLEREGRKKERDCEEGEESKKKKKKGKEGEEKDLWEELEKREKQKKVEKKEEKLEGESSLRLLPEVRFSKDREEKKSSSSSATSPSSDSSSTTSTTQVPKIDPETFSDPENTAVKQNYKIGQVVITNSKEFHCYSWHIRGVSYGRTFYIGPEGRIFYDFGKLPDPNTSPELKD